MTNKPKIQYVGQFYVYGSEAQAIQRQQRKKARTRLPQAKMERIEKIYVDPVAIVAIGLAAVALVVMVLGALRIRTDWEQYRQMKERLAALNQQHQALVCEYREVLDLDEVRSRAESMGLVPKDSVKTRTIQVTPPEPKVERTWLDDLRWFLDGLLE